MKILKRVIPIALIVILLFVYFEYEKAKSTLDPLRIRTSGYIEGHEDRLAALHGGRLVELFVNEGDAVTTGDKVARFDTAELELHRDEIIAAISAAQSQLQKLINGPRTEELAGAREAWLAAQSRVNRLMEGYRPEDIEPLRSQLDGAEASLDKAKADLERMKYLYDSDVISRSEYESAEMAVSVAESNRDTIEDKIAQLEAGYPAGEIKSVKHEASVMKEKYDGLKAGARVEDIDAANAEIARLNASLGVINEQIADALVLVSSDGYIREISSRPGDILPPTAPIATLIENGEMWVRVYVPSQRLASVHLGQKAYVFPDAMAGEKVDAEVTYISSEGEFTPRNIQTTEDRVRQVFAIKLTISSADPRLKPGMGCEVEIPLDGG